MVKLREVDSGHGDNLKRVEEFTQEHAKAILDHQKRTGITAWEVVEEGEDQTKDSVTTDEKKS